MLDVKSQYNMMKIKPNKKSIWKRMWHYKFIYLFILPALIWYFIFMYVPMYGISLAFKELRFDKGYLGSPWVGTFYFMQFINYPDFWKLIYNTFAISGLKILFGFPAPIMLALMLNEIKKTSFKRVIQTVSYLPYFVSWVVVIALFSKFLTPNGGAVNDAKIALFGGEPIFFLNEKAFFYPLVILTDIWKNVGWSSIIYLAALSNVSLELYEAAMMDGAGKIKSMLHITLPSLAPTITIMFILTIGTLMRAGIDQIYLLQNPGVLDIAEILDTHVVKQGLIRGQYSYATAVGLFQSIVCLIIVMITNTVSKKVSDVSLW